MNEAGEVTQSIPAEAHHRDNEVDTNLGMDGGRQRGRRWRTKVRDDGRQQGMEDDDGRQWANAG